jgi:DHA1 family bicyclomycin/chloramphenicol resistance-like MFS transporter
MSLMHFFSSGPPTGPHSDASPEAGRPMPGRVEFVAMMSLLMGLIAIGIDLMLPGMAELAADLGAGSSTDVAGIVTTYFLGLAVGQLLWGPLADRFGRKAALNLGLVVIVVGAVASASVSSLPLLLFLRFVWGFGASAARSTTMTVVRDRFRGDRMASVMSLIFSVFILVPVVAPTLGAAALTVTSWRGLFVGIAGFAVVMLVWLRRLPETLAPEQARSVAPADLWASVRVVVGTRVTAGYLWALTALSASFTAWLSLAEPVVVGVYDMEAMFPLIFGGLALTMAIASLANSRIVERVGARRLVRVVLAVYVVVTGAWLAATLATGGVPPLWVLMVAMALVLMSQAFLQSNAQSLAMDPMGEVAGLASAVIGAVSLGVGTLLGAVVQFLFDDTSLTPIVAAFLLSGLAALVLTRWAEQTRPRTEATPALGPVGAVEVGAVEGDPATHA